MKTYVDEYKSKLVTAEKAASLVQSGDVVKYGGFHTRPIEFDKALGARAGEPGLEKVYVQIVGSLPPAPEIVLKDMEHKTFQVGSWYYTGVERYFGLGIVDFLPINYHDTNKMVYGEGRLPESRKARIHVMQTGPMDKHGFFNFGITAVDGKTWTVERPVAIVEVNNSYPNCLGGFEEAIHISEIDYVIEGNNPPPFSTGIIPDPSPAEKRMAELIVEEVRDGCCLQLGIGSLPNTIGLMLADSDLKDLGIQTEMFCDSMVKLHESGRVNNYRKKVDKYKSTYSFALGNQETYDFLDNNPAAAACPVEYVNAPDRIMMQDDIISINNIVEVDLLTQVCSETNGFRQISGSGGQLDWVAGAFDSKRGKSFLAFASTYTDKEGKMHSRIRPLLTPGSVVTVPRHSVHWLVTEHGKALIKGLSVWERVEELVRIAHPDFRDELLAEAGKMGIWKRTNRIPLY